MDKWIKRKGLLLLLSAFFLLPLAGTSCQAEKMYTISGSELSQLETNFRKLKTNNEKEQQHSTELEQQLKTANEQIAKVRTSSEATQKSLDKANQYLTEYEREAEHKLQVQKRQKQLWRVLAIGAATVAVYEAVK